jgi:hypothetical protein
MNVSLSDWLGNGWLHEHRTSREEIRDLLDVVERDLADSLTAGLSADWRLTIAYNAALQAATVALYAAGYRPARDQHHYRVIQSLSETIGAAPELVMRFDQFRKKRNVGGYEQAGLVSDQEAGEMRALAVELRDTVIKWLRANHPELL